jgi:hypothetical protein
MSSLRGTKLVLALLFLIGVVALLAWGFMASKSEQITERQGTETPNQAAAMNGLPTVTVSPEAQAQSGILVKPLAATSYQTEVTAYGTVMEMQPLIDFRTRYAAALSEIQTARATAMASKAEYERSSSLYANNQNVSLKAMQVAQAVFITDQAKIGSATLNVNDIQASARQQFGEPLTHWIFSPGSRQFQSLLTRQKVLLRITLPLSEHLIAPATIHLTAYNHQRVPATLLSPSPQSDPVLQGRSFFYCADSPFAAGTRIVAYLPVSNQLMSGTFIPSGAIVWFGGQPWAYVQLDKDHFARRAVPQQSPSEGGFFVSEVFKPGEAVVVNGAQLLLSEEFSAQIKTGEESGDDD